jgi:hypothetical protein
MPRGAQPTKGTAVGYAKCIGGLGGLAVGLGIGAAMAATPGVAAADTTDVVIPVDGGLQPS